MFEFRTRYKVAGDDRWLAGAGVTERQCRDSANKYWRDGASEVIIEKITVEVVARKVRQ